MTELSILHFFVKFKSTDSNPSATLTRNSRQMGARHFVFVFFCSLNANFMLYSKMAVKKTVAKVEIVGDISRDFDCSIFELEPYFGDLLTPVTTVT